MTTTLDERLFAATIGALELFGVHLGTRLGLYRALADHGWLRAVDLAQHAGIHPRYAREWLEQQAVAGFVTADGSHDGEKRRYTLPAAHHAALVDADDAAHVAPFADMIVGVAGALDDVAAAYRSGDGVPYSRFGATFRAGQGAINRPAFRTDLIKSWLPAMPDVHVRLSRPGARIADIGCGEGWSTDAVAEAYPDAEVVGYDSDAASIEAARARGGAAQFEHADGTAVAEAGSFDAILLLESLHDMSRPTEQLAACRRALADGGAVIVADEKVADAFTAPGDDLERMMYGWSISHCLPAALAEQPSAALGTVLRADTVRDLATAAGFSEAQVVDVDAGFFRLYRLTA